MCAFLYQSVLVCVVSRFVRVSMMHRLEDLTLHLKGKSHDQEVSHVAQEIDGAVCLFSITKL